MSRPVTRPAEPAKLATLLTASAERVPARIAVRLGTETLSCAELSDGSARTAAVLRDHNLYEHPAVAEAAVVGVPHPTLGEEIAAVVTLRSGAVSTPDELRDFVRARVAPYKYPRLVRIADLPKGPTGKILKRAITVSADPADEPG